MNPRVHGLFCKFLERKLGIPEIDNAPHRKILMPREAGKSTLATQAYVLQRILQNPNIAILIANEKLENAEKFLGAIKQELLGNQLLRELFPDVVPDPKQTVWATNKIVVTRTATRREHTIACIGEGGTVTGDHPDLIVCDDIFSREAMENARAGNSDLTGKINRWISQLRNLVNAWAEPFPELLFVGTHWYAGDPYHYVEEAYGYGEEDRIWNISQRLGDGTTQIVPVRRKGDLAIFKRSAIEDGKTIWPENPKFTMEALAKARIDDPVLFACNMQNEPSDDVTATFKDHWFRYYDWIDPQTLRLNSVEGAAKTLAIPDLDIIMLVDPGGFGARTGSDRMRGAILVTGTELKGHTHLLLEAWSEQVTFHAVIQQILAFFSRYKLRKVAIEVAGQQAAFVELVRKSAQDQGITLPIEVVKPKSTVKEQRILTLEPYFQRGQIAIGKGPQFTEFREQYRQFPRGRRVDLLDALAYGPEIWRKGNSQTRSVTVRQEMEKQQYYLRRGIVPTRRI